MKNKIAILGCGWLGFPLARTLIADGCNINGSTTSEEKLKKLETAGIQPFLIRLSEEGIEGEVQPFLTDVDALIINVPPKLRGGNRENYVKKMQLLHDSIETSTVKKIIFVSSTSVYGDMGGEVTEKTVPEPVTESGKQLVVSEDIFRNNNNLKATIIRFGGLIGPDRHPVRMLSGRTDIAKGNAPVNLIHKNDCIEIIRKILIKNWWNETFNGVYPNHPTKREYYTSKAIEKGLQVPHFDTTASKKGKTVSSYHLKTRGFEFTTAI
ncbi:SDR family oxidoreductase [Pricia sp. S334]|uniref:SDR family oxidoreductase n=1 Tax=Pricia mediterranea TaxID=3076079 RepID=A0ABU3L4E8_9FLAO|nr:SDR family oxidoreductase [Pricia sp. S334]MDT7828620.1 SDR family oxidoreductase [Pricia sp. S334]